MNLHRAEIDSVTGTFEPQQERTGVSGFIVHAISGILPGKSATLHLRILANENKIETLYCQLADEAKKQTVPTVENILEAAAGTMAEVNGLIAETYALKALIAKEAALRSEELKSLRNKLQQIVHNLTAFCRRTDSRHSNDIEP